ncbi:MAG: protoporphyrinogen/coproporphyrinogen oxidase [Streptosporangiaceae bacterium]
MDRNFVVIGGGISGIASAHYLKQAGHDAAVLESADFLGGRIASGPIAGAHLDLGGKNIGLHYRRFREIAEYYGVSGYQDSGINTSRVIDGKMIQVEARKRLRSLVDLLGPGGVIAALPILPLALKAARSESDGLLSSQYFSNLAAKRDSKPLTSHFSKTVCDRLIRSMVVISNAAEPDECYLGNLGTNLRSLFDSYEQFSSGMTPLFEKFRASADVRLRTRATALETRDGRITGVRTATDDGAEVVPCTDVVLALPASWAASFLETALPEAFALLHEMKYFPVAVAVARYDRPIFKADHRALMFDSGTIVSNAGAHAADKLDTIRYTFSGRAARPYIERMSASSPADTEAVQAQLLALAETELGHYFKVSPDYRIAAGWRVFDAGLCAYGPYQARRVENVHRQLARLPGLHLTGDYIEGASIEACCQAAYSTITAALI